MYTRRKVYEVTVQEIVGRVHLVTVTVDTLTTQDKVVFIGLISTGSDNHCDLGRISTYVMILVTYMDKTISLFSGV